MVTVAPAEGLHGRREKREALERLLEAVRGGQGRVVACAESEVGETAVVESALRCASGFLHAPHDACAARSLPVPPSDSQRWTDEPLLPGGEEP